MEPTKARKRAWPGLPPCWFVCALSFCGQCWRQLYFWLRIRPDIYALTCWLVLGTAAGYQRLAMGWCSKDGWGSVLPENSALMLSFPCNGSAIERSFHLLKHPVQVYRDILWDSPRPIRWVQGQIVSVVFRFVAAVLLPPALYRIASPWLAAASRAMAAACLLAGALWPAPEALHAGRFGGAPTAGNADVPLLGDGFGEHTHSIGLQDEAVEFSLRWYPLMDIAFNCIDPTSILVEAVYGIFSLSCVLAMGLMSALPGTRLPRGFFLPNQLAKCVLSTLALLAIEWCRLLHTSRSSGCSSGDASRAGRHGGGGSAPGPSAPRLLRLAPAEPEGDAAAVAGGGEGPDAPGRGGDGGGAVGGGGGVGRAGSAGGEGCLGKVVAGGPVHASRHNGDVAVGGAVDPGDGHDALRDTRGEPEGLNQVQALHHQQQQQQEKQQQQQQQRQAEPQRPLRLVAAETRRLRGCTTLHGSVGGDGETAEGGGRGGGWVPPVPQFSPAQRLRIREMAQQMELEMGPGPGLAVGAAPPPDGPPPPVALQPQRLQASAAAEQEQQPQPLQLHARALPSRIAFRARCQAAVQGGPREGLPPPPGVGPSLDRVVPPPRSQHVAEAELAAWSSSGPATVVPQVQDLQPLQQRRHDVDHVPYTGRTTVYSTRIKVAGCSPEQVAQGYYERIVRVAAEAGLQLEAVALRRGCIELIVNTRAVDGAPALAGPEAAEVPAVAAAAEAAAPVAAVVSGSDCRSTRGPVSGSRWESGSGSGISATWVGTDAPPAADFYTEGDVLDVGLLIRALQLPESSSLEFDLGPGGDYKRGNSNSGGGAAVKPAAAAADAGEGSGGGSGTEGGEAAAAAAAAADAGLSGASSAGASPQVLMPFVLDVNPRVLAVGPARSSGAARQPAVQRVPEQAVAATAAAGGGGDGIASSPASLVVAVSWVPAPWAPEPPMVQTATSVAGATTEGAAAEMGLGVGLRPGEPPQSLPGVQILLRSRGKLVATAAVPPCAAAAAAAAEPTPLPPTSAAAEPSGDVGGGSAAADRRPRPSAEAEAAASVVARGAVSGPEGGGAAPPGEVLYGVDVGPLLAQLRPGVLLVDARLGAAAQPAAADSYGPAALPLLMVDDPRVASELQKALETWCGTADELDSLLYDMGALTRMQDELTACAEAAGGGGNGGGVGGSGGAALHLSALTARSDILYTHLVSYMEAMSWEGALSWLCARQEAAAAAVAAANAAAAAPAAAVGRAAAVLDARPAASAAAAATIDAAAINLTGTASAAAAAAAAPPPGAAAPRNKSLDGGRAHGRGSWRLFSSRVHQQLPPAFRRLSRLLLLVLGWRSEGEADAAAYASYTSLFATSTMNVMHVLDLLGFLAVMTRSSSGSSGGGSDSASRGGGAAAQQGASPPSPWLDPDKACVLVAASPGVVMAALWLLLPRLTWRHISARTKWPRQASYIMSKAMVAFFSFPQPPLLLRLGLGASTFLVEGVILPAAVLMSPLESVVMGLVRAPLSARMWLLASAASGHGSGSGRLTVMTAWLRALALSALNILTTVVVHLYIRISYERKRGSAHHAKVD